MTDKPKLKVLVCWPTYGHIKSEAALQGMCAPTGGYVEILPSVSTSSALCNGFNKNFANALDFQEMGYIDLFLMIHDDIEVRKPYFLDTMVKAMEETGAAVLSVAQAIKGLGGEITSTAVENPKDRWHPRRLTLKELEKYPENFTMPGLLINTGLMLVDLRRPEFHEWVMGPDGIEVQYFQFHMDHRIVKREGLRQAQFRPEDWNFSRLCHSRNLPVYCNRSIECLHYGEVGYPNFIPKAEGHATVNGPAEGVGLGQAEEKAKEEKVPCLT